MDAPQASILIDNFNLISHIVYYFSVITGLCLLVSGIFKFKRYGESRTMMSSQMSISGPLLTLLAGACLLVFPDFLTTALASFWGESGTSPLAYSGTTEGYGQYVTPILMFVRIVGLVSFIRGVILLSKAGGQQSQPGMVGKAFLHIFGGILALHVLGTIDLIESIFGLAT